MYCIRFRLPWLALAPLMAAALPAAPCRAQPAFTPPDAGVPLSPQPRFIGGGVELADVTGDGLLDVVVSDNIEPYPYLAAISVLVNLGGGRFAQPVQTVPATDGQDRHELAIALADLNGDGRADLVTTYLSSSTPPDGNRPNVAVLLGQPDGRFAGQVNLANSVTDRFMRSLAGRAIATGDVNGDGHADIVSPSSGNTYSVLPGRGDGTFAAPIQSGAGAGEITLLGDLDGDGDLDAVGLSNVGSDSRPSLFVGTAFNDGSGRMAAGPSRTLDTRTNIVHTGQARAFLADLDGDHRADLVVFGESGSQTGAGGLYVLRGDGAGGFTQPLFRETRTQDGRRTATILIADFDGDGDADILKVPNGGFDGETLVNDGAGGFTARVPFAARLSYQITAAAGNVTGSALPDVVIYDEQFGEGAITSIRVAENVSTVVTPPCRADWDASGEVDGNDVSAYINAWYAGVAGGGVLADFNADGETNGNDISGYINAWYAAVVNGGAC